MTAISKFGTNRSHRTRGSVLLAGMIALATLSAVIAASMNRSMTSSKLTGAQRNTAEAAEVRASILNLAVQTTKDYAWGTGQSLDDLLPASSNRFETWYNGDYEGVNYTVSVGDNSDESGTQDFKTDSDSKVYLRVSMDIDGANRLSQVLMSPGALGGTGGTGGPGDPAPANIPGSVGICYGFLNFLTMLSMPTGSEINGNDKLPPGMGSCPASPVAADYADITGACDSTNDQYGLATTSWFGSWDIGQSFNMSNHQGDIVGLDNPDNPPGSQSLGQPTSEECDSYDEIQTLADNLDNANDPSVTKYSKSWGTKTINGNLTFGTEANPEVLYIKTGWFGTVKFTGKVDGWGIIIADGNVKFEDDFAWNGVFINDANAIGNIATFKDDVEVFGGMVVNRPLLTAEVGDISADIRITDSNSQIYFSSAVIDSVMTSLDPNYVPPDAGADEQGQAFSIAAVQHLY